MQTKEDIHAILENNSDDDTWVEILPNDNLLTENNPLLTRKPIQNAKVQSLHDLYEILQMNGQFQAYTIATPIEFAIQNAFKKAAGTPFLLFATLGTQALQTSLHIINVIGRRLGSETITNAAQKFAHSNLPMVLFALSTSTKIWFIFNPAFKNTAPIIQAVAVPASAIALSFTAFFGIPGVIQCLKKKPEKNVPHKTITLTERSGDAICAFSAHDSNVAGIMGLLDLQKDTIFLFMQSVSNAQLIYIPTLFGGLGIVDSLCHTAKSPYANKISDYLLTPLWHIGQESLQSLYLWFQILALFADETKEVSPTTFWMVTGVSAGIGAFKVGLSLLHYALNILPQRQEERKSFYPEKEFELQDEWPHAELSQDLQNALQNEKPHIIEAEVLDDEPLSEEEMLAPIYASTSVTCYSMFKATTRFVGELCGPVINVINTYHDYCGG